MDGTIGKVVAELAHQNSYATVFWHLDNEYVGKTTDIHQMELSPSKGNHMITVVDDVGEELVISFDVE